MVRCASNTVNKLTHAFAEATSALDTNTERDIQNALQNLVSGLAIFQICPDILSADARPLLPVHRPSPEHHLVCGRVRPRVLLPVVSS